MEYIKCPWCNFSSPDKTSLESHLSSYHNLKYNTAFEISYIQKDIQEICYRCRCPKNPITFNLQDQYHVPCWGCLGKKERKSMVDSTVEEIKEYYNKVLSDRYLQLFLIDPIYFESTIPHDYENFKRILSKKELPSRNSIWFLDWKIGFPKIISIENLEGIEIKDLGKLYSIDTANRDRVKVNNYTIDLPLKIKFDSLHHGRYNILNPEAIRNSKRLRIPGTDQCYKFYNNSSEYDNWKSILRIIGKDSEEINPMMIPPIDYLTLKLVLLRNKTIMREIYFQIIENILKQGIGVFRDEVFLRNTITLNPIDNKKVLRLSWVPLNNENTNENEINISIL